MKLIDFIFKFSINKVKNKSQNLHLHLEQHFVSRTTSNDMNHMYKYN